VIQETLEVWIGGIAVVSITQSADTSFTACH